MFAEKIFAERLKNLRTDNNLTLKQLGDKIQVTKATVGNFENCNKKPSLDLILIIADYFDVSLDYLVGRSDDPTRH